MFARRTFLCASIAAASLAPMPRAQGRASMTRIRGATVGCSNVAEATEWYRRVLGYRVADRGTISEDDAQAWDAPACAGQAYSKLVPLGGSDVFVRLVEIEDVPEYEPLASLGWGAIEITVQDVFAVADIMARERVEILSPPAALAPGSPIRAMQVVGPGREVLYLTDNIGDRKASNHPEADAMIGRIFIMVLAGRDLPEMKSFYERNLGLSDQGDLVLPVPVLARAHGMPNDHKYDISVLVASERGNKVELDLYPQHIGDRPQTSGMLPPGVAMTAIEVADISALDVEWISPPARFGSAPPTAVTRGPVGELIEVISQP